MAPARKSRASTRLMGHRSTPYDDPTESSSNKNRKSPRTFIPDSDEEEVDSEAQSQSSSRRTTRSTRSFKGVFVPKMDDSGFKRPFIKRKSGSSLSSIDSPLDLTSDDGDTPATTPATSVGSLNDGNGSVPRGRAKGKRKREIVDLMNEDEDQMDTASDARLAQQMQEEEYQVEPEKPNKKKSRLQISDSEESELSSLMTEDSDDMFVPTSLASTKRSRTSAAQTPSRPSHSKKNADKGLTTAKTKKTKGNTSSTLSEAESNPVDPAHEDSEDDFVPYLPGDSEANSSSDDDASGAGPGDIVGGRRLGMTFQEYQERRENERRVTRMERERAKLESSHPEIKTMWDDLAAVPKIQLIAAAQPESITRKLKTFQLEGLNWMQQQEKTQWKGGLLGDEMGMGKTIQAVSLIMSDYPAKQPTLVVVPPVALMQWTNEINEYTNGKLKVLVYHGTNAKAKKMTVKQLKAFDVIMISYSGLESIYRKQVKGWTRNDDVVKEDSAIHSIKYHRLILDEAHSIKSRTTGVAKACFALEGTYKWCLSGTPVQNRIGEFFSLLRFLNVTPFANYFCKTCPCSAIHWSVTPAYRCSLCNHRALDHVSVFNQEILNPITSTESDSLRKGAFNKLRLLTDRIMLRRMKRDQTASMELPPKEIVIRNEFFGEIERDFSSSIMTNTTRQFDTYVSRGVMLNNYANIFGLIMQMRQVADHPDLLLKKHSETGQNVLVCNICDEIAEEAIRSRCKHEFCRACAKDYVKSCEGSGAIPDCPRCHIPLAIDFDQPDIEQEEDAVKQNSIINRIKMENWTSSTKIEMLVYDLYKLRSKKQTLKSIVFSQFTSMLQLIEWRLRRAGFNTVMLDGSMTPQQRQKSIDYFMNNSDVEVFLVSLKAGGVALNLTEASRVFIVDPWWNPAAEWQSADRCHRIGQKRPCVITRLCIEDSVESRIVMLQEKKAHLINSTVNNDEVAMEKLSPEDMQFLFRGS